MANYEQWLLREVARAILNNSVIDHTTIVGSMVLEWNRKESK